MASKSSRSSSAKRRSSAATKKDRNWGVIAASVVLAIFVIGIVAYAATAGSGGDSGADVRIKGVQSFSNDAGQHTPGVDDPVTYQQSPPVGGEHNPIWQNCGVYTEPIQNAKAVHSLEHGTVWITYQPDLPDDGVKTLRNDYVEGEQYMLLSPYADQTSPIVLTAWDRQLQVDSPDDPRIAKFIKAFRQGPTTPERGAACTDGVGQPVDRQATVNPAYKQAQEQQGAATPTPLPSESVAP